MVILAIHNLHCVKRVEVVCPKLYNRTALIAGATRRLTSGGVRLGRRGHEERVESRVFIREALNFVLQYDLVNLGNW